MMRRDRIVFHNASAALIAIITLLLLSAVLPSQPPSKESDKNGIHINTTLKMSESLLGDRNNLRVSVKYPARYKPVGTADPSWGEEVHTFSIRQSKPEDISRQSRRIVLDIDFAVFRTGYVILSPIPFKFKDQLGNEKEYATLPVLVKIRSLVSKEAKDIKDIKGPLTVHKSNYLILIIISVLLLSTAAIALIIYIRRRRVDVNGKMLEEREPPHIEAYRALDLLSRENLLAQGEYKKYYIRLSEIIRRYLNRRFNIETLERTTREILRKVDKLELSREVRFQLREFLDQCDLVKFAKFIPTGSQARESLEAAYYIVDVTREEMLIAPEASPAEEKHPRPVL